MMEGADQLQPDLPADQQPTVSGYVPGQHLFLVRNPSWDRATDDLRDAYADRIEIYDDDAYSTQLESLKSNQMDVSLDSDLDPGDEAGFLADPAITQRVRVAPTLASEWILLNLAVPPFDDIHVRRAIQLVTNKKALINILEPDLTVAHHAIPDAFENGLLSNYDPYATNGDAGDLNRAKAEMALSSYDTNHDGMCDGAQCNVGEVKVDDDAGLVAAANEFGTELASIGIQATFAAPIPTTLQRQHRSHHALASVFRVRLGGRLLQRLLVVRTPGACRQHRKQQPEHVTHWRDERPAQELGLLRR